MKVRYGALLLVGVSLILFEWGCKNNVVSTTAPETATISGTVYDGSTAEPLQDATVIIKYGNTKDSVTTGADGSFQFVVEITDTANGVNVTITVHETGYLQWTNSYDVKNDISFNHLVLSIDPSAYAVVNGAVRDSVSAWPLPGASVVISLPGSSSEAMKYLASTKSNGKKSITSFIIDSTTTSTLGNFVLNIPFPDYLKTVSATMTISKVGFVTYQSVRTFTKGTSVSTVVLLQQDKAQSVAHLIGQVTDSLSGLPITNVSVILTSSLKKDTTKTLSDGSFSFDFNLPGASSSVSGTLLFELNSYVDQTVDFNVNAGQSLQENIKLVAKQTVVGGDSSTARGVARSISLVSVSNQEISIHGVGRNETSILIWQVLDSLGFPIDINHQDTVDFIPSGIPVSQGGAYVTPTLGLTDGSGKVSTTVNSGTVAGTIQMTAKMQLKSGAIVQSSPVLITVDGGLPDQAHFEINSNEPHALNFAGYDWSEVTQGFTVQAGDKYGNPVAPGTAIYFTTSDGQGHPVGGIITAAGQTDAAGHANATLYSGKPLPKVTGLDPLYFGDGTGYAYVKAYSQGENSAIVSDSGLICFSASTGPILFNDSLSISPVILHNGGSVAVPVHLSDRFGNPLESGTVITATVDVTPPPANSGVTWKVSADGLPTPLGDFLTRGYGSTDFTLVVSGSENVAATLAFTVTVSVSGRNSAGGLVENTFSGVLEP